MAEILGCKPRKHTLPTSKIKSKLTELTFFIKSEHFFLLIVESKQNFAFSIPVFHLKTLFFSYTCLMSSLKKKKRKQFFF